MTEFEEIAAFNMLEIQTPWLPAYGPESALICDVRELSAEPAQKEISLSHWRLATGEVEELMSVSLPVEGQPYHAIYSSQQQTALLLFPDEMMLIPLDGRAVLRRARDPYGWRSTPCLSASKDFFLLEAEGEARLYSCYDLRLLDTLQGGEDGTSFDFVSERLLALHCYDRDENRYASNIYALEAGPAGEPRTRPVCTLDFSEDWRVCGMLEREERLWSFEVQRDMSIGGLDDIRLRVYRLPGGEMDEEYALFSAIKLQAFGFELPYVYFLARRWPELDLDKIDNPYQKMENPFTVLRFSCNSGRLETIGILDWPYRKARVTGFKGIASARFQLPWLFLRDWQGCIGVFRIPDWVS